MPVLVAGAISWAVGPALAAAYATAITVASYAIVAGAYYAFGTYQARQARARAKAAFNKSLEDRLVMVSTADAMRSRVYGRVRNVDGVLFKATHGEKSETYTFVVALAGHEVDAIESVYFADQRVTLDAEGYVQTAPFARVSRKSDSFDAGTIGPGQTKTITLPHDPRPGSISAGASIGGNTEDGYRTATLTVTAVNGRNVTFTAAGVSGLVVQHPATVSYQWDEVKPKARVWTYLGSDSQNIGTKLVELGVPNVTAEHRFAGIACLVVQLTFDQDAFPSGVPGFSAVLRGAKLFDPRNGLTYWSSNPALVSRDWALYPRGGGAKPDEIFEPLIIASANACDAVTVFPTSGQTYNQPRYSCDLVATGEGDPSETLNEIVLAMAGKYAWAGGILFVKAGFYSTPVTTIDETWLSDQGEIEITPGVARVDLVNVYRPTIADALKHHVSTPTKEVRAEAYIELDGQELPRDLPLHAVSTEYRAIDVCSVMLRDARQALTLRLTCNMRAFPLQLFDVVGVHLERFGWVGKEFELLTWEFAPTGDIELVLKETGAVIFDPNALFETTDALPNTRLPTPWIVAEPTGLDVVSGTAALRDGSILTRTLVSWSPAADESVRRGRFEVQFTKAFVELPAGDWDSAPPVDGTASSVTINGLQTGVAYLFRVRAINALGVRSIWSEQVTHVVAPPPAVSGTWQQETAPENPNDGDLWEVPSTGVLWRWNAAAASWIQFGNAAVDWTNLEGRPLLFRVVAQSFNDSKAPTPYGLYNDAGTRILGGGRSYNLAVLERATGAVVTSGWFDVYGDGENGRPGRAAFAAALSSPTITSAHLVVVWTSDEPLTGRLTSGIPEALYRHGASRAVFGAPTFGVRSAYVLVGIGGIGEGGGYEAYSDGVPYASGSNGFCDVSFLLRGGSLIVTGAQSSARSLADYGYTGTLDATTDLRLVARGQCTVAGNYARKVGGTPGWGQGDVYSLDAFFGACFAASMFGPPGHFTMFGLNADPTSGLSYTSLDRAWYQNGGEVIIYENGNAMAGPWPYSETDVFAVLYDGSSYRYTQNGVVRYSVAAAAGLVHYFDSAFNSVGGELRNIRFAPMSPNNWEAVGGSTAVNASIAAAQATANAASNAASTAQAAANAANAHIAEFANDNVLSPIEKPRVLQDWNTLQAEWPAIQAQAIAFGITSERTTYALHLSNMGAYLGGLGPYGWADPAGPTNINGAQFRQAWVDTYGYRQTLLNRIAEVAALTANWAYVQGVNVTTGQIAAGAATETRERRTDESILPSTASFRALFDPITVEALPFPWVAEVTVVADLSINSPAGDWGGAYFSTAAVAAGAGTDFGGGLWAISNAEPTLQVGRTQGATTARASYTIRGKFQIPAGVAYWVGLQIIGHKPDLSITHAGTVHACSVDVTIIKR